MKTVERKEAHGTRNAKKKKKKEMGDRRGEGVGQERRESTLASELMDIDEESRLRVE